MVIKPGAFTLAGNESWTKNGLKMLIQDRPDIEVPRRKLEFVSPLGVSGELVLDEKAYESTTMTLSLLIEGSTEQEAVTNRALVDRFFNYGQYMDFVPYFDENKTYSVICTDPAVFTTKWWMLGNQTAEVTLKVKPYKYYRNVRDVDVTSTKKIVNPYGYASAPLIRLEGTGDIDLTVAGTTCRIKNVEGHVYIDTELFSVYRKAGSVITNDNNKAFFREFPYLYPGNNTISWTGKVTKVLISPRWRTLV